MLPSVSARTASGPTFLPSTMIVAKTRPLANRAPSTTSKTLMFPCDPPVSTT